MTTENRLAMRYAAGQTNGKKEIDMTYETSQPVEGCPTCRGTGGANSCPIHSHTILLVETLKPFVQLIIRCPCCGKDMQFDGYAMKERK